MIPALAAWLSGIIPTAAVRAFAGDDIAKAAALAEALPLARPEPLRRAVAKRRREFLVGRYCARGALAELGLPDQDVAYNADRSPGWPRGAVGSITHTDGLVLAVAAPQGALGGLGVDAEVVMPLETARAVSSQIAAADELTSLAEACPELAWERLVTLVFSAKEALYKCLYPRVGGYFGFEAARLESIDVAGGSFRVRVVEALASDVPNGLLLPGYFQAAGPLLLSCVVWRRPSDGPASGFGL
jgi:enterobactin synthetase component D